MDGRAPVQPDPGSGDLASLSEQRSKLLEDSLPEPKRKRRAEAAAQLKRVAAELAKFPKPQMVYAGTVHYGTGSFVGTGPNGGKPRTISLLVRGDVNRPDKEVSRGPSASLGNCLRALI